jgi:hypothetical protein
MKKKKTKKSKENLPYICDDERLDRALDNILDLLEPFCEKYLNEEYWDLCHDMTVEIYEIGAPLDKGKPQSWASGVVHALGMVNFLQDPSFEPYMESSQIAKAFGVSQSTMQSKSKLIRDNLDLMPMDPDWCLESMLADNPLVWMFETKEGFIGDFRDAPREIQEQAYREGLIPFIPLDYQEPEELESESKNNIKIIEFPSGKKNKTDSEPESVVDETDSGPTLFDNFKE